MGEECSGARGAFGALAYPNLGRSQICHKKSLMNSVRKTRGLSPSKTTGSLSRPPAIYWESQPHRRPLVNRVVGTTNTTVRPLYGIGRSRSLKIFYLRIVANSFILGTIGETGPGQSRLEEPCWRPMPQEGQIGESKVSKINLLYFRRIEHNV